MNRPGLLSVVTAGYVAAIVLAFTGWQIADGSGARHALAVLVLVTPLGFVIARHLPVWLTRRVGRASGLTHVGVDALEAATRVQHLVIDAHGTVTTGQLVVTQVQPLDPTDERTLRWFAGALAHLSSTPINRAIARLATTGKTTGFSEDPEHGIRGSVDRHPVRVGRADWLDPSTVSAQGSTVAVEIDHRPFGHITVADEVRGDAERHLSELARNGIHPVLVSSGTIHDVARIAELSGAEDWHAATDAPTQVTRLGGVEAGVGSVAVRRAEATDDEATVEAELVLPGPDGVDTTVRTNDPSIRSVAFALYLVRRARSARRLALQLAAAGGVVLIPLAAGGLIGPAVAGALGATVLAVVALSTVVTVTRPSG